MKKFISASAAALVLLAAAGGAEANLITNGGFETGTFSGWTIGGNTVASGVEEDATNISAFTSVEFDPTFTNVRTGTYSAFGIVRGTPSERIFLEQTINVVAGQTYDVGYYVATDAANFGYAFIAGTSFNQILVGSDSLVLQGMGRLESGSEPSDFRNVFSTFTAASTGALNVSFRVQGSGTGRAGFSVDDFYFTSQQTTADVPAPATLALFGLGLAGLGWSRRKKI